MKINKTAKNNLITYLIVTGAFLLVEILSLTGNLTYHFGGLLVPICVYVIAAVSLNLVVGISGELSLGHAGFMCIGAYAGAFFSKLTDGALPDIWRFILALIVGALVAGIFGMLISIPVLRLKGDYLAIVTLAFGEIIKNVLNVIYIGKDLRGLHFSLKGTMALGLEEDGMVIVNGPQGISRIPGGSSLIAGFILILITLFIVLNIINSRTGRAIMAIRDNRIAAESVGINVSKYKMLAFSISAALAGVAGSLYAHNIAIFSATKFDYNMSILILVFVVLGGIGNIRGSVIAAVILYALPEMLRGLSDYRMLIYAVLLIAIMLFNQAPAAINFRTKIKAKLSMKKNERGSE